MSQAVASLSTTTLAVQAALIRTGLSAAEARVIVSGSPERTAWIETCLQGKSLDLTSRDVAAVANDLRGPF
jgi:hypothetical protein